MPFAFNLFTALKYSALVSYFTSSTESVCFTYATFACYSGTNTAETVAITGFGTKGTQPNKHTKTKTV